METIGLVIDKDHVIDWSLVRKELAKLTLADIPGAGPGVSLAGVVAELDGHLSNVEEYTSANYQLVYGLLDDGEDQIVIFYGWGGVGDDEQGMVCHSAEIVMSIPRLRVAAGVKRTLNF